MRQGLPFLGFAVLAFGAIFWRGDVRAQDETIISATQLVATVDQSGLCYPLVSPTETPLSWPALGIFWADFSQLTNAIGDVRNFEPETQYGVSVWHLRLTRTADETVFSYPAADTNLLRLAASEDGFSNHYDRVLWTWCILAAGRNYESYEDLLADGYTFLDPKRLVFDITLADINDCETYQDNASGGMFMMMSHEDSGDDLTPGFSIDGDPCSITNLLQPFSIISIQRTNAATTITWESCPIFRYRVLSADALSLNTMWMSQSNTSYIWGQPGASATSWTDLSTTNASVVTQRFYKVEKLLGNQIATGGYHTLAVLTNGTLWTWGGNDRGQLGDGVTTNQWSPEEVSSNACLEGINNAQALAGGFDYTVVADSTGVVWTCGDGATGQLGNGGSTNMLTPSPISGISNVVSVAAGVDHTLALRADGTVWAWGNDEFSDGRGSGKLGVGVFPPGSTNSPIQSQVQTQIVAVAAGGDFSMALDKNGKVWTWGENNAGVLGNGGTSNTNLPTLLTTISNVIAVAAGGSHVIALTTNKTVWTWGADDQGQLGRSNANQFSDNPLPQQVTGLSNVVAIAAGSEFSLAVISNGQVYAWGDNSFGQLGTNVTDVASTNLPMLVAGISNVVLVAAQSSGNHSLAVTVMQGTNQYWAWGEGDSGEIGNGTNVDVVDAPTGPLPFVHFNTCAACIQLGTNGTFTASASGTLFLYFNDNKAQFNDNSGSYTASVTGLGSAPVIASNPSGVVIGTVTNGGLYTYTASGLCTNCFTPGCGNDASGVNPDTGILRTCGDTSNFICPGFQCYSLVGKIE